MKDSLKKVLKYLLSMSLAVVLLWFSFREVEWADFADELASCRWGYIILSMAAPKADQSWVFIGRTDVEAETPLLWPPYVTPLGKRRATSSSESLSPA